MPYRRHALHSASRADIHCQVFGEALTSKGFLVLRRRGDKAGEAKARTSGIAIVLSDKSHVARALVEKRVVERCLAAPGANEVRVHLRSSVNEIGIRQKLARNSVDNVLRLTRCKDQLYVRHRDWRYWRRMPVGDVRYPLHEILSLSCSPTVARSRAASPGSNITGSAQPPVAYRSR